MEDRITPALYLELSDLLPTEYAMMRAPELARVTGAERITWWGNCNFNREDLPREIDDFPTLGIVETDLDFEPPKTPEGTRGHLFHRTSRPGQGILSNKPTLGLELVLVSPRKPEQAQEFRDWADFIHIRDIAAAHVPHFTMITPYQNAREERPKFMHFYELDTEDAERAFKEMTPVTLHNRESYGAHSARKWANHETLLIEYVNTFRLLGEFDAESWEQEKKNLAEQLASGRSSAGLRGALLPKPGQL